MALGLASSRLGADGELILARERRGLVLPRGRFPVRHGVGGGLAGELESQPSSQGRADGSTISFPFATQTKDKAANIKGYVAFYKNKVQVTP